MCGILCIAGPQAQRLMNQPTRRAAMESLERRGPDAQGIWYAPDQTCALGHTRLAIVDTSDAGAQPMLNETGDVCISCNGEIYNAPELRLLLESCGHTFRSGSDSEVIVHAYEQWGIEDALDRLRGMFAFVLWDGRTRTLHAAVDHAGMKPLVWHAGGGSVAIASTCDALAHLADRELVLDRAQLAHVLCHGCSPAPRTVWEDVHKLAPGSRLSWNANTSVAVSTWWRPPMSAGAAPNDEEFPALLERVARRHMLADVPVSLLLSGGIDSTALACALAQDAGVGSAITLSLASTDDEAPAAAKAAGQLGLHHVAQRMDAGDVLATLDSAASAFDEPQGFGSLLTMCMVSRAAAGHAKVVISGDGGDECFAGYTWNKEPMHAESSLAGYAQRVLPRFTPEEASVLLGAPYRWDDYIRPYADADAPALPWPRRAQRLDLLNFCASHVCPKVDRAMMHHSVELRAPFLDRDLLEWSFARAPQPNKPPKALLRTYISSKLGQDAEAVLSRPKQGFSLRLDDASFYASLHERVEASSLESDGIIGDTWRDSVRHERADRRQRIYALGFLATWWERRRERASATRSLLAGTTPG